MQQSCRNCGALITAGMPACTRCGAPVSLNSGSYSPTVRTGMPPGTGYGQQPYGPPPADPYGMPPPQPGYGGAPGVGYGWPQQPLMGPQRRPKRAWIPFVVGIGLVVLLTFGIGVYAFSRALTNTCGTQHICNVQIGIGDNQGTIMNQTNNFSSSDTIVMTFTATTQDSNARVRVKLDLGSQSQTLGPLTLQTGQHNYYDIITVNAPGDYTAELQYNGTTEQSVTFTVS